MLMAIISIIVVIAIFLIPFYIASFALKKKSSRMEFSSNMLFTSISGTSHLQRNQRTLNQKAKDEINEINTTLERKLKQYQKNHQETLVPQFGKDGKRLEGNRGLRTYQIPVVNLFKDQLKEVLIVTCSLAINTDREPEIFEKLWKLIRDVLITNCAQLHQRVLSLLQMDQLKQKVKMAIQLNFPDAQMSKLHLVKTYQETRRNKPPVIQNKYIAVMVAMESYEFLLQIWIDSKENHISYLEKIINAFMAFHLQRELLQLPRGGVPAPEQLYTIFESIFLDEIKPIFDTLGITLTKYLIPANRVRSKNPFQNMPQKEIAPKNALELLAQKGGDRTQKMQAAKQQAKAAITEYASSKTYISSNQKVIIDQEQLFVKPKPQTERGKIVVETAKKAVTYQTAPDLEPLKTTDSQYISGRKKTNTEPPAPPKDPLFDIGSSATDNAPKPIDNIDDLFEDKMDLNIETLDF